MKTEGNRRSGLVIISASIFSLDPTREGGSPSASLRHEI